MNKILVKLQEKSYHIELLLEEMVMYLYITQTIQKQKNELEWVAEKNIDDMVTDIGIGRTKKKPTCVVKKTHSFTLMCQYLILRTSR